MIPSLEDFHVQTDPTPVMERKGDRRQEAVDADASVLSSTVDGFTNRLKRKLKEQEELQDASSRAASARGAFMLQGMASIRRALQETAKISLGERFRFRLDVTDWEGWPRVELVLVDKESPDDKSLALVIVAHDRNEMGTVQMSLRTGEVLARVHLRDQAEFQKLPILLKRSVRQFLDIVMAYVLKPARVEHVEEIVLENTQPVDATDAALRNQSVFTDDEQVGGRDNVADLYTEVAPLEALPLFAKS